MNIKGKRISKLLAVLSLTVATASANQVCYWWFNQPEMPESGKSLRKF